MESPILVQHVTMGRGDRDHTVAMQPVPQLSKKTMVGIGGTCQQMSKRVDNHFLRDPHVPIGPTVLMPSQHPDMGIGQRVQIQQIRVVGFLPQLDRRNGCYVLLELVDHLPHDRN